MARSVPHARPARSARPSRSARARAPLAVVAAGVLLALVAGCSSAGDSAADRPVGGGEAAQAPAADSDAGGASGAEGSATDRQVISTGWIVLTTDDPVAQSATIVALVEEVGGRIDSRNVVADAEGRHPSASLTVRIPSDDLTTTLAAFDEAGEVLESQITSEDVTGTAVDLDARIRAKELSIERLEALLAAATTTADVLTAEETLTQRQSELEQLESQRALLADQVSMSTVTVDLVVPDQVPVTTPPGFVGGWESGWTSLVAAGQVGLAVLGFLIPWLIPVTLVVLGIRWLLRVRDRRRAARPQPVRLGVAPGFPAGHAFPGSPAAPAAPVAPSSPRPDAAGYPAPAREAHASATAAAAAAASEGSQRPDPEARTPEARTPDTAMPDTATPDTAMPDTAMPDTATPDTAMPDTATPDTAMPDTATPVTTTPDMTTPDTATPEDQAPDGSDRDGSST